MSLELVPITLRAAHIFVDDVHRHHKRSQGGLFAVGCSDGEHVVGVAVIARPVARQYQDGWTAEVRRVATNGTHNACSMLYGAAWRACRALGYRRLVTYTLQDETGASLRGAGWKLVAECGGGSWSRKSRPRVDDHPLQRKLRWERATLGAEA